MTTYAEAEKMLADMEADVLADMGEEAVEAGWTDIVEAACLQIEDDSVVEEICRCKLGWMPQQLRKLRPKAALKFDINDFDGGGPY